MPLRFFSRTSPKKTASSKENHGDGFEHAGKEFSRPPLFPLPETAFNTFHADLTPGTAASWLSSSAQPDLQFFESQENFASLSPDKSLFPPSSVMSNPKLKLGCKESKLRLPGSHDAEYVASLHSSASSGSLQDNLIGNPDRSTYTTPRAYSNDSDSGSVTGTPVARSLKYNQSASSNSGAGSALPSTAIVPTATTPNVNAAVPISSTQPQFEIEEDSSFWKDHNVQVVIRLRPLNSWELATQGHSTCIRQDSAHELTWTGHPESRFTFDLVACETITQEKMFKVAGLPMVDNCMAGYNSCMFAYGQTGSGKTYTMLGDLEGADQRPSKNRGMTTRVFEYLFARIDKEEEARKNECLKFVCRCSFLEIYNEQILDLLEPTTTNLQMREDAKKGVYVENLSEVEARNVQDVIRLLLQGAANRKVASTNMNRESSRSHSVFTCVIESKWTSQSVTNSRFGRLNLVDLAGSERQKSSGAEGERLKEAANINKSLSTLGLVIMSLVDIANGKQRHVPYRDSKLTFLLHDSLGGNSKTTIIANISPSNCCAMETLSTLKFAQRAKFIRNNATINENASGDVMALRLQIQQLKQEVNTLRLQIVGGPISQGGIELLQQSIVGSDRNGSEFFNINNIGHSAYSLEAWDSLKAFASPTFNSKKKKELELAFVGSLRREHAGEARIRQLSAEIEHFKRLLKQREEDSQCSKMTIRFREDKIKRLESFLGGLISSDTYIMEEKNSLLEEVQILRTRLERNPEVTRFAMENIRLLEELRRFQDFYEAGERDTMAEEIAILRDQLLEALDWKLMHEQDPDALGRDKGADHSALKEENELLQMEVERFQREVEFLRNNLSSCLDVKEKLERRIDELQEQIDRSNDLGAAFLKEAGDLEPLVLAGDNFETVQLKLEKQIETVEAVASTQADLIAMREAVAATSAGEHDARERVCKLEGEIEILQNDLQELREVYECALLEKDTLIKQLTEAKDIASKKVGVMQRLCPKESNQNGSNEQEDEFAELYGYEKNLTERAVSHDLTTTEERMCEEAESQKPLFSKENRTGAWDDHEIKEVGLAKNKLVDEDSRADLLLVAMEKKDMELHGLRTALEAAQRDLEKMRLQRAEELFVDKPTGLCQDAEAKMEKKHMEMHESRTPLTEELFVDKPADRTCQDAQRDREKIKLQRAEELCVGKPTDRMCQDADSHRDMLSVCLEEQYLLLQNLEKRAMGIMQHFKGEIEELDHVLQKMNMKELEEGKGSFVVLIDAIATEVALLEPAIDAKEMCLQSLRAQLENTETKLKEAEQARDDVCLLSTLEKQSWMEDKTMLQQKLENTLELLSCKDNMVNEALLAARANLDLLEAKLSTFSMLNDRNMVLVSNESEITMKTIMETSLEVLKVEKEVKLLEESLCVVQLKLAKADNKVNALRNILLGFSSAKEAWVIREERMQEHLQSLGGILAEKERELAILHAEEENITNCLNELVQEEELVLLEAATLKEKLQTAEESRLKDADSIIGLNGMIQASVSMLQLLRGQEEKVTLLSVLDDAREKLKRIRVDIEDLRGQRDKKDTATLCAQVELEVITTTLQEAEIEMEEIQKEKMVLVETEAEGTSELESIVSEREKAESEVREIEEQLKVFQSHLKRLEEKLSQEGHSKCAKETLVTDLDGKILVDTIAECLSLLLDVKHNLFKREHLEC